MVSGRAEYVSEAVKQAARLQEAAPPGQVNFPSAPTELGVMEEARMDMPGLHPPGSERHQVAS